MSCPKCKRNREKLKAKAAKAVQPVNIKEEKERQDNINKNIFMLTENSDGIVNIFLSVSSEDFNKFKTTIASAYRFDKNINYCIYSLNLTDSQKNILKNLKINKTIVEETYKTSSVKDQEVYMDLNKFKHYLKMFMKVPNGRIAYFTKSGFVFNRNPLSLSDYLYMGNIKTDSRDGFNLDSLLLRKDVITPFLINRFNSYFDGKTFVDVSSKFSESCDFYTTRLRKMPEFPYILGEDFDSLVLKNGYDKIKDKDNIKELNSIFKNIS